MTTQTQNGTSRPDTTPPDVWRQKTVHTVTGPSGATFKIRIPGIAGMLERAELPTHLVGIALLDISHRDGAAAALRELVDDVMEETGREKLLAEVKKLGEYQRHLVAAALVEPTLTFEEVSSGDYPEDDLAMVAEIVQRLRGVDARGVRIGVEPLDRWATFHREHGLGDPDGCDDCLRAVQELSSIHVGAL